MPNQASQCGKEKLPDKPSASTGQFSLKSSGKAVLNYEETATQAHEGKRIHPRRPVPLVPEARAERTREGKQEKQSDAAASNPE
jgi:hypothetical protein